MGPKKQTKMLVSKKYDVSAFEGGESSWDFYDSYHKAPEVTLARSNMDVSTKGDNLTKYLHITTGIAARKSSVEMLLSMGSKSDPFSGLEDPFPKLLSLQHSNGKFEHLGPVLEALYLPSWCRVTTERGTDGRSSNVGEWEQATSLAVAFMRQHLHLFHKLQIYHDKAARWLTSNELIYAAREVVYQHFKEDMMKQQKDKEERSLQPSTAMGNREHQGKDAKQQKKHDHVDDSHNNNNNNNNNIDKVGQFSLPPPLTTSLFFLAEKRDGRPVPIPVDLTEGQEKEQENEGDDDVDDDGEEEGEEDDDDYDGGGKSRGGEGTGGQSHHKVARSEEKFNNDDEHVVDDLGNVEHIAAREEECGGHQGTADSNVGEGKDAIGEDKDKDKDKEMVGGEDEQEIEDWEGEDDDYGGVDLGTNTSALRSAGTISFEDVDSVEKALKLVEFMQVQVTLRCMEVEEHIKKLREVLHKCLQGFNSSETYAERNTIFDEFSAMVGDDVPPREGFLEGDWRKYGVKGLRSMIINFLLSVHDLAEARLILSEFQMTKGESVSETIYDGNRGRWSFSWNGKEMVAHVLHSLNFLREIREVADWYGRAFFFLANPLMLPFNMATAVAELGLDKKAQDYLDTKPHYRVGTAVKNGTQSWQHKKYLSQFQKKFDELCSRRQFNWPTVPIVKLRRDCERVYTAMLVLTIRSSDHIVATTGYEKKFISLLSTVRGKDLMVGNSGLKPVYPLKRPPIRDDASAEDHLSAHVQKLRLEAQINSAQALALSKSKQAKHHHYSNEGIGMTHHSSTRKSSTLHTDAALPHDEVVTEKTRKSSQLIATNNAKTVQGKGDKSVDQEKEKEKEKERDKDKDKDKDKEKEKGKGKEKEKDEGKSSDNVRRQVEGHGSGRSAESNINAPTASVSAADMKDMSSNEIKKKEAPASIQASMPKTPTTDVTADTTADVSPPRPVSKSIRRKVLDGQEATKEVLSLASAPSTKVSRIAPTGDSVKMTRKVVLPAQTQSASHGWGHIKQDTGILLEPLRRPRTLAQLKK